MSGIGDGFVVEAGQEARPDKVIHQRIRVGSLPSSEGGKERGSAEAHGKVECSDKRLGRMGVSVA